MLLTENTSVKNPCKPDCPNRHGECHANCEDYKRYRAKQDEFLELRGKANQAVPDIPHKLRKHIWKEMKRR